MNILKKKNLNQKEEEKINKGRNRPSIFTIFIIVLSIIAVALVIKFINEQNQILNENYNIKASETKNIVGRTAVITESFGDVVINRNRIDIKGFNDFRLQEGDVIKTGLDSFVKIDIDGNKLLKMDNNSIIQIATMSGNQVDNITTIVLSNGRLMNYVKEKLNANSRYEVKTLNTVIGVKGTVFVVTCQSNEDNNYFTKVENLRGSVEVAKVNIQDSNQVLDKVVLDTNKYTVAEEKINKQEKLKSNEIDKNKIDDFIKIDLDKILIEENNKERKQEQEKETNTNIINKNSDSNTPKSLTDTKSIAGSNTTTDTRSIAGSNTATDTRSIAGSNTTTDTRSIAGSNTATDTRSIAGSNTETDTRSTTGSNTATDTRNTTGSNTTIDTRSTNGSNTAIDTNLTKEDRKPIIIKDLEPPTLIINGPNISLVRLGEQIKFVAQYFDNVGIKEVVLRPGHIVLYGFKADISVTGTGVSRIILLSNIKGDIGKNKYVEILPGTAIDTSGNVSSNAISTIFSIERQYIAPSESKQTSTDINR